MPPPPLPNQAVSLTVTPKTASVPIGLSQAMRAEATLTNGQVMEVTELRAIEWSSSDTSVATIGDDGVVIAKAVGSTTIMATGTNADETVVTDTAVITVTNTTATALTLTPKTATLATGLTQTYHVEVLMSDGDSLDVTSHPKLSWSSSDTTVAIIEDGIAQAVAAGTTTITILGTVGSQTLSDTATLTVTEASVVRLEVQPADASVAVGLEQAFTAQVVLTDNTVHPVTEYATWSTNNLTTALVSDKEGSKGIAQGRAVSGDNPAEITASLTVSGETYRDTATLNVLDATITDFRVTPATVEVPVGQTQSLKAEVVLSNKQVVNVTAHANVSWSSDNSDAVTVDNINKGQVKGENVGSATITATGRVNGVTYTDTASVTVTSAVLDHIVVTPATQTLPLGTSTAFTARAYFSDNSSSDITASSTLSWSSSDTTIATISNVDGEQGMVMASSEKTGTVTITATETSGSTALTATATLEVTDATVTVLQITPPTVSVAKGLGQSFTATAILSNNLTQEVTSAISWTSSDPALVIISNDAGTQGYATAVEVTETPITITATGLFNGQTFTQTAQMSVTDTVVTELQVTPTTDTIPIGLEKSFTARAFFSDSSSLDVTNNPAISWTSGNDAIATVSATGVATGMGDGETQIIASGSANGTNFDASATLTVTDAIVASLEVTPAMASLPVGLTQALEAIVTLSDGKTSQNVTDNAAVTWASSDPTVATVSTGLESNNGIVTGVSAGNAIITAQGSANGTDFSAQMTLTITSAIITNLQIEPATDSVPVGLSAAFTARALLSDNSTLDVTDEMALSWSSSNTATATITSANADGGNGVATGKDIGSVTITASGPIPEGITVDSTAMLEVTDSIITELTVTPTSVNLAEGLTQQFTATARYSDGVITEDVTTQPAISWTVESETGAATISETGLVTGEVSGGTATVKASGVTPEGTTFNGQATVTVIDAIVTDLQVTPATQSTPAGTSVQFTATAMMSNGSSPTITDHPDLHWTSSDPAVASITTDLGSGNGYVTTLKAGTVTITASGSANGTAFEGTATLTATAAIPVSITVTPTSTSVAKGLPQQFTSEVTYSDNSKVDMTTATTWTSSDTTVADIGLNTGLAQTPGTGTVTITGGGDFDGVILSRDVNLTVTEAEVVSLNVAPTSASIPAGTTQQLTTTATMTDSSTPDVTTQAVWSSSDTATVTIGSATGLATGESVGGPVTMTATYAGHTATSQLTVTTAKLESIMVTPNPAEIEASSTTTLIAMGNYTDGTTSDITTLVGWTGQNTTIATVASGTVTGITEGTTSTIASLDNGYGATISSEAITINVTPFVLSICGGTVDDTDPTNATTKCIKVVQDADGRLFTSTPSIAVMNALGYEIGVSGNNTYASVYSEDGSNGPSGEFAQFTQIADNYGQVALWCENLNTLGFAGKTDWRRPISHELISLNSGTGNLWSNYGWPVGNRTWSTSFDSSNYFNISLLDGFQTSNTPDSAHYASCVSGKLTLDVCGGSIDDADQTNAVGECVKITMNTDGHWFTSSPSLSVMELLGYVLDSTPDNIDDTYSGVEIEDGTVGPLNGTFATFKQNGLNVVNPGDGNNLLAGKGGQYDRWCNKLNFMNFGGKNNWRRVESNELLKLHSNVGQLYLNRGWPLKEFYSSKSIDESNFYYRVDLDSSTPYETPTNPSVDTYVSCISE
nr:Ig-like domain-containing protein [Vibrio alginolyticus]